MDALELRERLDRAQRDLVGGDLLLKLLRELQDPQVLAHARLRGLEPLRDALDGQPGVEEPLVAAGAGERIEVSAQVILDQGFHEEIGVLVVVAGASGSDDRWQLHHGRLDRRPVAALAGDQHVVAVLGRADADRLQAAVLADRLGHLLELAIVLDLAARVEPVGDDDPRERQVTQLHAAAGAVAIVDGRVRRLRWWWP